MSFRDLLLSYTPPEPKPLTFRGQALFAKQVSAADHLAIGRATGGDPTKFPAMLLEKSVIDADGKPVFQEGDAAALDALPWELISEPYEVALSMNRRGASLPKAVTGPNSGLPTTSASTSGEGTSFTLPTSSESSAGTSGSDGLTTSGASLSLTSVATSTPPSSAGSSVTLPDSTLT